MRSQYELLKLAAEAGIATTKLLHVRGVELTVDKPRAELVEELRARGLLS